MKKFLSIICLTALLLCGCNGGSQDSQLSGQISEQSQVQADSQQSQAANSQQSQPTEADIYGEDNHDGMAGHENESTLTEEDVYGKDNHDGMAGHEGQGGDTNEGQQEEGEVPGGMAGHEQQGQISSDIETLLGEMSIEEKVGQMFFARFPGDSAPQYVQNYHLGGYVLFAVDFEGYSADQVRSRIDACQDASRIPMLMGVDEEGGTVTRVSDYFRGYPFMSPRDVYAEGGYDLIASDTEEKCELLKSLHLNVNLAPVCDIAGDPSDFMYKRSFSGDPQEAAKFVDITINEMNKEGVGATLKHFPGYGNNADTHTGIAFDYRSRETFYDNDFIPFEAGIEAGAGSVLVCHNIVDCFDSEYPASLSPEVHRVLREDLGFEGVIMTDDLSMGAILDYCGEVNAAVLAVEAGNDLLISTEFEEQYASVMNAVESGRISEERIDQSVRRILNFKKQIGLL